MASRESSRLKDLLVKRPTEVRRVVVRWTVEAQGLHVRDEVGYTTFVHTVTLGEYVELAGSSTSLERHQHD